MEAICDSFKVYRKVKTVTGIGRKKHKDIIEDRNYSETFIKDYGRNMYKNYFMVIGGGDTKKLYEDTGQQGLS